MIAALPMYDWAEVRGPTDRLWRLMQAALRARGIAAPDDLTRGGDMWADWQSPDLLLGQTCGFPFRTRLHGNVTLLGTPDYGLPGAAPGHYYSQLVVRRDEDRDLAGCLAGTLAINGTDSQSGFAAPLNHAAGLGLAVGRLLVSGAHVESARAVAEGRADIAAIDAVTWRLVLAHRPAIAQALRVIDRTQPQTPGLPYITAKGRDGAAIGAALAEAIAAQTPDDRAALGLVGFVHIPAERYLAVPVPALP